MADDMKVNMSDGRKRPTNIGHRYTQASIRKQTPIVRAVQHHEQVVKPWVRQTEESIEQISSRYEALQKLVAESKNSRTAAILREKARQVRDNTARLPKMIPDPQPKILDKSLAHMNFRGLPAKKTFITKVIEGITKNPFKLLKLIKL